MKIIICFTLVYITTIFYSYAQDYRAQTIQKNNDFLAKKMAKKLQDSLKLTNAEYNAIYEANIKIHREKLYTIATKMSRDSIGKQLQKIERSRDSVYSKILSADKQKKYIDNKRYYINNGELKK